MKKQVVDLNFEELIKANISKDLVAKKQIEFVRNQKYVGVYFKLNDEQLDFKAIKKIINVIYLVHYVYYKNNNIPITIDFTNSKPIDKLTVSVLECICYHTLVNLNHKIQLLYNFEKNIYTNEMIDTAFTSLSPSNYSSATFTEKFYSNTRKRHYRKIYSEEKFDLSVIISDIAAYSEMMGLGVRVSRHLGKLTSELVENALTHGKSACIVDLDITDHTFKKGTDANFSGVNISVLNLSHQNFFLKLKNKMNSFSKNKNIYSQDDLYERYLSIFRAYEFHKTYFSKEYTEKHFWSLASLQHHISGRSEEYKSNGVGLTKLISMVQEYSDADFCYMMTDNINLNFRKEFMKYNNQEEKFIGLNSKSDFQSSLPDNSTFGIEDFFFPGTAFNLSFAIEV